ncbi:MAG: hypothetical protein K2Y21_11160 [Phycisphaerales bacterium]|nr:hypothetical protein [Phycisphaerales bacterium]
MKTFVALAIAGTALSAQAAIITQWNFEAANLTPSIGLGTASLVGGVTATFASGFNSSTNGWNTTGYPAAGGNKSAGVQFAVSTSGFQGIKVSYAHRHSNTSANTNVLQYTVNGTTWIDAQTFTFTPAATGTGDTWYSRSFDFTGVAGVDNNALFAVRVVSSFAPSTSNYLASRSTSTYAGTGTYRFDDVTIEGTAIPTSGSLALAGMGLAIAARRRRA